MGDKRGVTRCRSTTAVVLVAAVVAATAACGSGDSDEATETGLAIEETETSPPLSSPTVTTTPGWREALTLPLRSLMGGWRRASSMLDRRAELSAAECMNQRGFDYTVEPPIQPSKNPLHFTVDRYSSVTLEEAPSIGYTLRPDDSPNADYDLGVSDDPAERERYDDAYWGTTDEQDVVVDPETNLPIAGVGVAVDGCFPQARIEAYGSREAMNEALTATERLNDLSSQAWNQTMTSKAAADLTERWRTCMTDAGYDVAGLDTFTISYQEWPAPRPGATEIATATADATCQIDVGFVEGMVAEEARRQQRIIENNPELVSQITDFLESLNEPGLLPDDD